MTMEKQTKIVGLKCELNGAILKARLKSQIVGTLAQSGSLKDFLEAQSEERVAANEVDNLVDALVKEALNDDNK